MPLSYQTHSVLSSASGNGLRFSVTYSFLLKAHVKLYYGLDILAGTYTSLLVDGADYEWTSSTQVTLTSAPLADQTLTIIRDTPDSTQQVVWQDGSNLIADDMNTADRQNLFVVQEQQDRNDLAATKAIDSETASNAATTAVNQAVLIDGTRAMTGDLNVNSNKVVNLANPTAGGDAVNKTFADATYQPLDAELTELATMASNTAAALADLTQAEVNILDGATVSTSELNTLDGVTASAAELNTLDGVTSSTAELNILDGVTATAAELNALDGITASTAELNKLDGVTASTAELNTVDGVTSAIQTQLDGKQPLDAELTELATMQSTTASALADLTQAEVQILDGATVSTVELNTLDGITATATELNVLDGSSATTADLNKLSGVSATSTELNTLDGITSTTTELNVLDGVTATTTELNVTDGLTASTAELNQLDGKTISSTLTPANTNDIPTSSAVNTFVSGLLNALGGFVAIANETSFPTTNPDPSDNAGTVVSIADAGGVVVNSSGVSTTGRTTGNATVTITGFPSSLQSTTLGAGLGLQVQTTTTLNTYTYHKLIAKETDVVQLSDDINDFNERYRVSDTAPTTDLDEGDLWYDRTANKMKVYDTSTSAWKEVQSVGNFFINTLSSSSGTGGGSTTFNGSAYRFTLSNAGAVAQQMLVSVNGVVQKPNSGTSQPSEGFAIDQNDIIFAAAPASGATYFIVTIGSAVNIGTPSANTVNTSELVDGAVTNAKVSSSAAIAQSKLDLSITNAEVNASAAIASSKLAKPIDFADNEKARFGTGNDLEIYHDGTRSRIHDGATNATFFTTPSLHIRNQADNEDVAKFNVDGAVELYYDNSQKLVTKSDGIDVTGEVQCDTLDVDGTSNFDGQISVANAVEMRRSSTDICVDVGQTGVGTKARINADGSARFNNSVNLADGHVQALLDSGNGRLKLSNGSDTTNVDLFGSDGSAEFNGIVTSHDRYRAHDTNGGIYMGDTTGGFGDACAMARAEQSGYHASGSAAGDLVLGPDRQKSIVFGTTASSTGGLVGRCRVTSAGHFEPMAANVRDLGSSSNRWRNLHISSIYFNGDTASANALHDYEEGTWTPVLGGGSGFPSHTTQHGHYTKIGRLVHCRCNVTINSKNTLSGNLSITGLPFTVSNVDSSTSLDFGGFLNYWNNLSSTAYFISANPEGGQTIASLYFRGSGNAMDALSTGGITNTFSFRATFSYYV